MKVKSLSSVQLLVTPWTAAYQAPPSLGFSRQESWCHCLLLLCAYVCVYIYTHTHTHTHTYIYTGLCAPLLQLCLTLWDPMDCSPPGSSVHGILQARILEWVTMPFSRESPQPTDQTGISCASCISCIESWFFTTGPLEKLCVCVCVYIYVCI